MPTYGYASVFFTRIPCRLQEGPEVDVEGGSLVLPAVEESDGRGGEGHAEVHAEDALVGVREARQAQVGPPRGHLVHHVLPALDGVLQ